MADKVGKSRPAIANAVRLLAADRSAKEVAAGNLPAGQARALLGLQADLLIVSAARKL